MTADALGVYLAINSVQADLASIGITKFRENSQQNYMFRGIDDIYNAVSGILAKNKLCIIPRVVSRVSEARQSRSGGTLFYVTVGVHYDFVSASDGSSCTAVFYGEAMDSADKATNKAMSAAYKYMMIQTFCIPTEGDNDADARTHEPGPALASHQQVTEINAMLQALGKTWGEFSTALGKGHPAYAEHESELNHAAAGFWLKVLKKRLEDPPMTEAQAMTVAVEAEQAQDGEQPEPLPALPEYTDVHMAENLPNWQAAINSGRATPERIIALVSSKYALTGNQEAQILNMKKQGD